MEVDLLGVTLDGPKPLGRIHYRFESGVSVLYGLNGAGKSTLLRGLESALTGVRREGTTALHLRCRHPTDRLDWDELDWWDPFIENLACHLVDHMRLILDSQWVMEAQGVESVDGIATLSRRMLDLSFGEPPARWERAFDEVAEQGTFTLVPTGVDGPAWSVWLGCQVGEDTPTLSAAFSLERESKAWLDDLKAKARADELSVAEIEEALLNGPPAGWGAMPHFLDELAKLTDYWRKNDDPHWVPIPLAACGTLRTNIVFSPTLEAVSEQAVRARTIDLLDFWGSKFILVASDDDQVVFAEGVETSLARLSSEASNVLAQLLSDAPVLRCDLRHPREWVRRPAVEWLAYDTPAMVWVPVTSLSEAQRRWALFSIATVLLEPYGGAQGDWSSDHPGGGRVLLLDEPERALHVRAQEHLAKGLVAMCASNEWVAVAATHSPALLMAEGVRLQHVARGTDGTTEIKTMPPMLRAELDEGRLGLNPVNLLQFIRVFLVVEGEHDAAVVEGYLERELDEARVEIMRMRGAHSLRTVVDSQLIFEFTNAAVVVVLDRVRLSLLQPSWQEAQDLASRGRTGEAIAALRPPPRGASSEEQLLYDFCRSAIDKGRAGRIEIFGLAKPDIIEYLPVGAVVPSATSWEDIKAEWGHSGDFKEFLRSKGANVSAKRLRKLIQGADNVPSELVDLLALCRRLASSPVAP